MNRHDSPRRGWAAGLARPHGWPCRHCGMVTEYHLVRDAQLRAAESLDRRDEIDRLITFKQWLRVYEWDTDPRRGDEQATATTEAADPSDAEGDKAGDNERGGPAVEAAVPHQRVSPEADPVAGARRAVAAIPDLDPARRGDGLPLPYTAFSADHIEDGLGVRDEARDELAAAGRSQ